MDRVHDQDADLVKNLLESLKEFQRLKAERWEAIEGSFQMSNRLGTPSEDWIIPPDEKKVEKILKEDPDYLKLRTKIESSVEGVKEISQKESFNLHHALDWIKFTDPLLGTSALHDAIQALEELIHHQKTK